MSPHHDTRGRLPEGETVLGPVVAWAGRSPDHPAIIEPAGKVITYRDLTVILPAWNHALSRVGLKRGSRIALVLPNGAEMAAAFLGVTATAVCVPLNPSYSREEFSFFLTDTGCDAVLGSPRHPTAAEPAADELGIPCYQLRDIEEVVAGASPVPDGAVSGMPGDVPAGYWARPDENALILHTSGTTGRPKRVPLRQDRVCRNAAAIAGSLGLTTADRCLNLMPLFHVHGLIGCLLATLYSGGTTIAAPGFQPDRIAAWLRDLSPTWYSAVPAIHHALLRVSRQEDDVRHRLRFIRSCSAPLPPSLLNDLEERFRVPVIEAYGMTEAAHQIASNPLPPSPHKPGSVGVPTGYSVSIRSPGWEEQVPGDRGEVWISGDNLFSGYEGNPAANAEEFRSGFFRTGDEGYVDDDGYLHLTGRVKELINKGGEKVAPREIEEVFLRFPGVDQAVAFSIPHPELGEDIGIILVASPNHELRPAELRQHALIHLAPWKVPSKMDVRGEIPKGPTGKIIRRELSALMASSRPEPAPGSFRTAEETCPELEEPVRTIWKEVLQREQIGPDEDFFAIGGYSLTALAITTRLEQEFGTELPPTILFEAPTIRELAAVIGRMRSGMSPSYLVPFTTRGERVPLFLVPPGLGNAFYYRDFSSLLGPDQPFFSFSWLPVSPSPGTIEGMAAKYVEEVVRVLPAGPLIIGGYCFGAVISLEMAHQLRGHGREVRLLVIIDPENLANGPGWTWVPRRQTWKDLLLWLIRGGPGLWRRYAVAVFNNRFRRRPLTEQQRRDREVAFSHFRMSREYQARAYPGPALVFHHEQANETLRERWNAILGESAGTVTIPGTKHHEVLTQGGREVADAIRERSRHGEG